MIDPTSQLSINQQARVLGTCRGSVYYQQRPISDADLKLMHRIDKLHMGLVLRRCWLQRPVATSPDNCK